MESNPKNNIKMIKDINTFSKIIKEEKIKKKKTPGQLFLYQRQLILLNNLLYLI